ncbi:MAG: hypothetical protein JRE14_16610 [Deltaproteobacteria bacterium]|nr:hypothetical protein [Deltaproteobacteria bacterium]
MNGKQRILSALSIEEADRVPLFIHGINEGPIMGVGKHLVEGLPVGKQFHQMNDTEKGLLIETLLRVLEEFEIDGYTCLPIGPGTEFSNDKELIDDWGVGFTRRMMRGAFVRSWRLIGMTNYMMMLYDNPDFIHRVAEMVTQYSIGQLEMLIDAGLDVLIVEDDIADKNNTLISPDQFKTFIHPYNRKLVDRAHAAGLKVVRHSDGNLWPILDMLLESGYDGLNPLEPQAGMLLKKVKNYCGDRLCLLGNIDCQDLLPNGTPEQVKEAVRTAIADAADGGGLIICSSNTLHPGVDPDNCIAMFEATRELGGYK